MKTKVALLVDSIPEASPYVQYYIDICCSKGVEYDLLIWNRDKNNIIQNDNYVVFNSKVSSRTPDIIKYFKYFKYSHFIKNKLKNKNYSAVIVFSVQLSIFMSDYLQKKFNGNIIVDIRDYSIIMNFFYFRKKLYNLLDYSKLICISSLGFKEWLPEKHKYILSHNISHILLKKKHIEILNTIPEKTSGIIKILTIGMHRDKEVNYKFMRDLGNDNRFFIYYAGIGPATSFLEQKSKKINNVSFIGKYSKEEEFNIVKDCDLINIMLSNNVLSKCLTSNRFYLSLMHKKPMIVNSNCYQAYLVNKYNLGIVINEGDDTANKILNYIENFDIDDYNENVKKIMDIIEKDLFRFEEEVIKAIIN